MHPDAESGELRRRVETLEAQLALAEERLENAKLRQQLDLTAGPTVRRARGREAARRQGTDPRKAMGNQESDETPRPRWLLAVLASGAVAAIISGGFALAGIAIDRNLTPPTADTRTVCTTAYENVKVVAREQKISDPAYLERINSEAVDRQCGEEVDIERALG